MEDDLVASLTRQVKDEVIENYLTQRRLVELQTEDLYSQAEETRFRALKAGRRLNRLAYLVVDPERKSKLVQLLSIPDPSFWSECLEKKFSRGVRFIRVSALTDKGKFKKLFLESYHRLYQWMEKYKESYENLKAECDAININIKAFQKNFDLLSLLSFLRSLDTVTLERKTYLGENFTAQELASVDQKLYLHTVPFEKLEAPPPLPLPRPEVLEGPLSELALQIYRKYQQQIKRMLL